MPRKRYLIATFWSVILLTSGWCSGANAASPALAPAAGAAVAEAHPAVVVPNFWDPKAEPDKPDLRGMQAIRFLTEDDHPPFGFTLPDGTLIGFDIDLARAICDELQLACTIQARRFDTIVAALNAGSGDAAIASMAITPAALRDVDFTAAYYRTPARFVARRDTRLETLLPETIGAARVGVLAGTAHEAYLKTFFPTALVQGFGSVVELRQALLTGTVEFIFGDGITLAGWLNMPEAEAFGFVGGPFTESRYFGEGAGIAVKKGNGPLRAALDYALARLAAKGTYADLYLKYFPISVY